MPGGLRKISCLRERVYSHRCSSSARPVAVVPLQSWRYIIIIFNENGRTRRIIKVCRMYIIIYYYIIISRYCAVSRDITYFNLRFETAVERTGSRYYHIIMNIRENTRSRISRVNYSVSMSLTILYSFGSTTDQNQKRLQSVTLYIGVKFCSISF